jgi:hypothetical protein
VSVDVQFGDLGTPSGEDHRVVATWVQRSQIVTANVVDPR